jgi:serine/threonine-protein phosphatase 2B regulatory subunit
VIDSEELFQVLKMMVGDSLTEGQLQVIVRKTMIDNDHNGDGVISRTDFAEVRIDISNSKGITDV